MAAPLFKLEQRKLNNKRNDNSNDGPYCLPYIDHTHTEKPLNLNLCVHTQLYPKEFLKLLSLCGFNLHEDVTRGREINPEIFHDRHLDLGILYHNYLEPLPHVSW